MNMENKVITLTFGEVSKNHIGSGFNFSDLNEIKKRFEEKGCKADIYSLNDTLDKHDINKETDNAHILIIRNAIQTVFNQYDELCTEQLSLDYDKKTFSNGILIKKRSKYNLSFDDFSQEPSYEEGKGRIIAFTEIPVLNKIKHSLNELIGEKFQNMKCDSNYYFDTKLTGMTYHGDSERRKVVAIRLGSSMPIHYQWYKSHMPVGSNMKFELNGGDMYIMSEKAVGTDFNELSKYTLRHATGSAHFTRVIKIRPYVSESYQTFFKLPI